MLSHRSFTSFYEFGCVIMFCCDGCTPCMMVFFITGCAFFGTNSSSILCFFPHLCCYNIGYSQYSTQNVCIYCTFGSEWGVCVCVSPLAALQVSECARQPLRCLRSGHGLPPLRGGVATCRLLSVVPSPQTDEHGDQGPHCLTSQSRAAERKERERDIHILFITQL